MREPHNKPSPDSPGQAGSQSSEFGVQHIVERTWRILEGRGQLLQKGFENLWIIISLKLQSNLSGWIYWLKWPETCLIPLPTLESPLLTVRQSTASSPVSFSDNINEYWEILRDLPLITPLVVLCILTSVPELIAVFMPDDKSHFLCVQSPPALKLELEH